MELEKLKSYEILEKYELSDIASVGYRMVHKKTGARVCLIENDDNNIINDGEKPRINPGMGEGNYDDDGGNKNL